MQINTNKSFIIHYNDVNDSEMKEKKAIKIYCVCQVVWLWCNVFVCLHSKSKLYTQCRNDDSKIVSSNNKRYGCIETERNEERERKKMFLFLAVIQNFWLLVDIDMACVFICVPGWRDLTFELRHFGFSHLSFSWSCFFLHRPV